MSGADDLRAARESRVDLARRAGTTGLGDRLTHMVEAAVYRTIRPPASPSPKTTVDTSAPPRVAPLGADFVLAMRAANDRVDALGLSEVRTAAGVVRYLDTGVGAPVLLVHGMFGGSDAALRQFRPLVPDGVRLVAPSRFGYLGSTLPADATPAGQADAFAALLDELGIARTAVLAASAGATSALQFAIRYPARVSSLVLVSPVGPGPKDGGSLVPRSVARAGWGSNRLMWLVRRYFTNRLLRRMGVRVAGTLSEPDRERVVAELDGIFPVDRRVDGAMFDAFVSGQDINHDYDVRSVTAPTLIVHARDDALVPFQGAVALSQAVPDALLLAIEHGGHLMFGEHPDIEREIHDLLTSTSD